MPNTCPSSPWRALLEMSLESRRPYVVIIIYLHMSRSLRYANHYPGCLIGVELRCIGTAKPVIRRGRDHNGTQAPSGPMLISGHSLLMGSNSLSANLSSSVSPPLSHSDLPTWCRVHSFHFTLFISLGPGVPPRFNIRYYKPSPRCSVSSAFHSFSRMSCPQYMLLRHP